MHSSMREKNETTCSANEAKRKDKNRLDKILCIVDI